MLVSLNGSYIAIEARLAIWPTRVKTLFGTRTKFLSKYYVLIETNKDGETKELGLFDRDAGELELYKLVEKASKKPSLKVLK
jgi:hypothetical protein